MFIMKLLTMELLCFYVLAALAITATLVEEKIIKPKKSENGIESECNNPQRTDENYYLLKQFASKSNENNKCSISSSKPNFQKSQKLNQNRCNLILERSRNYEPQNVFPNVKDNTLYPNGPINLTLCEQKLLSEVRQATRQFPEETTLRIVGTTATLLEALALPKFYIKKFIAYSRSFESFNCLAVEDQLSLVKGAYVPVLNTRFAFVYDPVTNRFPTMASEDGEIAIYTDNAVLYDWNKLDMPNKFTQFQVNLHEALEQDPMIRNLICARFLFSPSNDLQKSDFVYNQHLVYSKLLVRYLAHKYQDEQKATQTYTSLMDLLSRTMKYQQETIKVMFEELGLAMVDPVHKELFDL